MPTSSTPAPPSPYRNRVVGRNLEKLPPSAVHRQEFGSSLIRPPGGKTTINPRQALLRYARSIGLLKRYQHLDDEAKAKLADYFGPRFTMITLVTPTIDRVEFINRVFEAEEAGERIARHFDPTPDRQPDTRRGVDIVTGLELPTAAELRIAYRAEQRRNRQEFAKWLRSRRKGLCNPQRAFRDWAAPGRYSRFAAEASDIFGPDASRWIASLPRTDRLVLADQLEEKFP